MPTIPTQQVSIPTDVVGLDAGWVSRALGFGEAVEVTVVPIGAGNASDTVRLGVQWAQPGTAPTSFVAKLAAAESDKRVAAGHWRAYEVEASFYRHLGDTLGADIPRCYWAGYERDAGTYAVILEDLGDLRPGDDVVGAGPDDADRALAQIALVHGARWDDPALAAMEWLNRYPRGQGGMLHGEMTLAAERVGARYADDLSADVCATVRRFADLADRYDRKGFGGPRTITHGDLRNDNVMFGPDRACLVDWQTVQLGAGLADVAYYLGGGVSTDIRRVHEGDLVRAYHQRLTAQGVELSWDACWREYRRHGLCMLTTALKAVAHRDLEGRGRDMVLALIGRAAQQAMDLESLALLTA